VDNPRMGPTRLRTPGEVSVWKSQRSRRPWLLLSHVCLEGTALRPHVGRPRVLCRQESNHAN
jgi:hypothetical protein